MPHVKLMSVSAYYLIFVSTRWPGFDYALKVALVFMENPYKMCASEGSWLIIRCYTFCSNNPLLHLPESVTCASS